jgi:excisionase family DNA binding protein
VVESTRDSRANKRLMTIEQTAERLGVSVRHVRRLVYERRVPFVKWGHLLRFDPVVLDRWIEESSVPSEPPPRSRIR